MPASGTKTPSAPARILGWLAGFPAVALLATAAILAVEPTLAARHAQTAAALADALAAAGAEPWLRVTWQGRDARAEGEAPDEPTRLAARGRLGALPDLRSLDDRIGLVTRVSPFAWQVTRLDRQTFAATGHRPADIGRGALAARLVEGLPTGDVRLVDDTHAVQGAPPDFPTRGAYALRLAAHLAPAGRVTLTDATLALSGRAASPDDAAALRALLGVPPAGVILDGVAIAPPRVEPFAWSATRGTGSVELDGFVPSQAARELIAAAMRDAVDGGPIEDRAAPAEGLPEGVDPAGLARVAGSLLGLLSSGRVALEGDRLSVAGTAVDAGALPEIEAHLASDLAAAGLRRGSVAVQGGPVASYRVTIRREADRVTLAGHLPDAPTRDALREAVRPRFFGERILDHTRIAAGAPEGLGAALTAGLDALSLLASGEVAVEDRRLVLAGESLYRGTARQLRAGVPGLPPGWSQTVTIRGPQEPEILDPAACRARLAAAGAPIRFAPGSADLEAAAYPVLDAVARLARLCPETRVEVAGRADPADQASSPRPAPAPAKALPKGGAKAAKASDAKASDAKASDAKASDAKGGDAKRDTARDEAPAAEAADVDLPRRRALAVVDYLLKAGVPAERARAVPAEAPFATGPGGEAGHILLVLRS